MDFYGLIWKYDFQRDFSPTQDDSVMDVDFYNAEELKRVEEEKKALEDVNVCLAKLIAPDYLQTKTKLKLRINKITVSYHFTSSDLGLFSKLYKLLYIMSLVLCLILIISVICFMEMAR